MDAPAARVSGIGLGLRQAIAEPLFASELPELRFVELHPENYVGRGGRFRELLARARRRWPILTHGLTLGFGAVSPFPPEYTGALRDFLRELRAPWHSEHLCFSGTGGVLLHDLLPLPRWRETVDTAARRVRELRERLRCEVAIENISYYAQTPAPQMDDAAFLTEVLERADCKLLLDVNNVYVNSRDHGFDPYAYIDRLPAQRVVQLHVAGHLQRRDGLLIDTHGAAVRDEVYALLEHTLRRVGRVPVLLERDQGFPEFSELAAEIRRLHAIYVRATGAPA